MKHETRLILALAISAFIFLGWYSLFPPPKPKPVETAQTVETKSTTSAETTTKVSTSKTPIANQVKGANDALETSAKGKVIEIDTDVSKILLSTRGGVFTSYKLKDYKIDIDDASPLRNLVSDTTGTQALFLGFKGYSYFDAGKVYEVVSDNTLQGNKRVVVLEWKNKDIKVTKTFTFGGYKTPYGIDVAYSLLNLSNHSMELAPFIQNRVKQKPEPKKKGGLLEKLKFEQPDVYGWYYLQNEEMEFDINWKEFKGNVVASGSLDWAALADRYFIFASMPGATESVKTTFDRENDSFVNRVFNPELKINPGEKLEGQFVTYIGPKKIAEMTSVQANLDDAIDYGWFSILAFPVLWLMAFLHKFISNWGLVIIVMTFIIKMLLHPVNKKSMQGMKAMQQLQPKLKELKEKYPDDKQKQQQQIMQLFRTHKVNPMSGCLPMILQMPIYIVLYKVLWNSIDLYHAPFFGPYKDLSAPDPYFILPILLGVFMFLQQKLTPNATADSSQQKMMMIMPIMFTGFMLFLPVGLVVYIFVNTVMSVVQQFMIKRDISLKQFITGKWQPKPNGA